MNDRDRDAADDRMREDVPSEEGFTLEDNVERGCEDRYCFLRGRDDALVVYRVRVRGGRVVSVREELFIDEGVSEGCAHEERWILRPESGEGRAKALTNKKPSFSRSCRQMITGRRLSVVIELQQKGGMLRDVSLLWRC